MALRSRELTQGEQEQIERLSHSRTAPDDVGFQSERLWIWYHNTDEGWVEPVAHMHESSDECFIVLQGSLIVEVEGERHTVGPREFCCFPAGVYHRIVEVHTPAETIMLRSPLVTDKVYQQAETEPPAHQR